MWTNPPLTLNRKACLPGVSNLDERRYNARMKVYFNATTHLAGAGVGRWTRVCSALLTGACLIACNNQVGPVDGPAALASEGRTTSTATATRDASDLHIAQLDAALGRPVNLNVAVPPDIEPQVLQLTDEQYEHAITPYAEILQQLTPPKALEDAAAKRREAAAGRGIEVGDGEPPLQAQRLYLQGRQAMRDDQYNLAVKKLEAALEQNPQQPHILATLSKACLAAGDNERAAEIMRRLIVEDPTQSQSLYLLGRIALEERRNEDAIAYLEAARRTIDLPENESLRGVMLPLIHARLAEGLRREAYARAAIQQFAEYLSMQREVDSPTSLAAELFVVDRQQPAALIAMGDLYNQLDAPGQALVAYRRALENSQSLAEQLLARQLYTHLRLGQNQQAAQLLIKRIQRIGPQPGLLELLDYLREQGVADAQLVKELQHVYEDEDHAAGIALVLADMLPQPKATQLLLNHLAKYPQDQEVFDALLWQVLLPQGTAEASEAELRQAVLVTLNAMDAAPQYAGSYAARLVRESNDPKALLTATQRVRQQPNIQNNDTRAAHAAVLEGLTLYTTQQLPEALEAFDTALDRNPDSTAARLQLVKLLISQDRFERAEKLLQPIENLGTAEIVALRAQILVQTGRSEQAVSLLEQTMEETGLTPTMSMLLARLELANDNADAAEQVLLEALDQYPTDEDLYESLFSIYQPQPGQAPLVDDAPQKTQMLIARIFRTIPNSRLARIVRARALAGQGQTTRAEELLKELVDDYPRDVQVRKLLVELYMQFNRPDDARQAVRQMLEQMPDNPEALKLAIALYQQVGAFEQANQYREKLIMTLPASWQRASALAQLYARQGRTDQAVQTLREAEQVYPEHIDALQYQQAQIHLAAGQTERYEKTLEQLLERNPHHASAANDLGYQWVKQQRNLEQARDLIQIALDAEPDSPSYQDSMGWAQYMLGHYDQAVKWLQRADQQAQGSHPVILDHLGDALYRAGQPQEARQRWQRALRQMQMLEPVNDPEIQQLEQMLPKKIQAVEQGKPAPVAATAEPMVQMRP